MNPIFCVMWKDCEFKQELFSENICDHFHEKTLDKKLWVWGKKLHTIVNQLWLLDWFGAHKKAFF